MSWDEIAEAANTSILATFGAYVTVTQGAVTTDVIAVISKLNGPWMSDGQVQISQHAYQALIKISDLDSEPVLGTRLTTLGGTVYAVDQPPVHDQGLYRLILKRLP